MTVFALRPRLLRLLLPLLVLVFTAISGNALAGPKPASGQFLTAATLIGAETLQDATSHQVVWKIAPKPAAACCVAAEGGADFYVGSNGTAIAATGYRAVTGGPAVEEALGGVIAPRAGGTYITFNDLSGLSAEETQSLLQLPRTPSGFVSFDTLPLLDDLSIPNGNWGASNIPEPITNTFPQWGAGGGTQAITNSPISVGGYQAFGP